MIYTSSELDFQGDSEFQLKKFKISSVAPSMTALCFRHISGKCDLHQSGWPIHHQDLILKGALNIQSEFKNSISGTCHGHISVWGRLRENITPSNQDDLYIILTAFSRGFWPSDQNFEILSVASTMAISVFYSDFGKHQHPPMKVIYISCAAVSMRHLESKVRSVKLWL